ncbi:DUF1848 domain-containing protein [Aeromonas sp. s3]|uniref:DUF1848 domain-containing protein n=1 Tax=Aeromonas sp. s3 TaxID=3138485 RepID=UPI0034A2F643
MILSASRRTDIPAFYTPWFMNRIRAGFLLVRNPFNAHQISRISLLPSEVDAIVFWTRNPQMLMTHLDELDSLGYRYYFQYTITGYPKLLEHSVPRPHRAIATFSELSDRIGKDRVIWRYDPILLSNIVDLDEHKRLFKKIASMLEGKTSRVVISFADLYKKTERNLDVISELEYKDILHEQQSVLDLSSYMSEVASAHGMEIESCAEGLDLSQVGVSHGKCIDDALLMKLFGISLSERKDSGQRAECGCIRSVDIGVYNTCLHGCSYCYATYSQSSVLKNKAKHDPRSPFLIGGTEGVSTELLCPEVIQGSLF